MLEWLIWLVVALIIIGIVLWIVKAYVLPALPQPIQNAVMAIVGLICIVALLIFALGGRIPGH